MNKLILLLLILLFSPFNLLANENKYSLEIESILLVMRKEIDDNKLKKKYASDPIDSCRTIVSLREKNNLKSFMTDICKKEVDLIEVIYF